MKIEEMTPFPPNVNPFTEDLWSMGQYLGKNVTIMYMKHTNEFQPYIVVIDKISGKRVKIEFEKEEN